MMSVILSSKFMSVSIDGKDSDEDPNITRALKERFINMTVEYSFWRLVIRGRYVVALHSLFIFTFDSKPTVSSNR